MSSLQVPCFMCLKNVLAVLAHWAVTMCGVVLS